MEPAVLSLVTGQLRDGHQHLLRDRPMMAYVRHRMRVASLQHGQRVGPGGPVGRVPAIDRRAEAQPAHCQRQVRPPHRQCV